MNKIFSVIGVAICTVSVGVVLGYGTYLVFPPEYEDTSVVREVRNEQPIEDDSNYDSMIDYSSWV